MLTRCHGMAVRVQLSKQARGTSVLLRGWMAKTEPI
jgi:hypothetical protein